MSNTSENTSITIRAARPSEAAPLSAFGTSVFAATYGHTAPASTIQTHLSRVWSVASFESDLSSPAKSMIVATTTTTTTTAAAAQEDDEKIIGFLLLTRGTTDPSTGNLEKAAVELQRLYVDPRCQGKGVARKLFQRAVGIAREEGFGYMWLGVWENADWAQRTYERFGFKTVGSHPFEMGDVVHTDLVMVKEL